MLFRLSTTRSIKGQLIVVCIGIMFHIFRIYLKKYLSDLNRILKFLSYNSSKLDIENISSLGKIWIFTVLRVMFCMLIDGMIIMFIIQVTY